jgi:mRNA-degrading endonuclease RelE of RelBE toxin-antitoxin system
MIHRPVFLGNNQAQIEGEVVTFQPLSTAMRFISPSFKPIKDTTPQEEGNVLYSKAPSSRSLNQGPPPWYIAFTKAFLKSIEGLDSNLKGRILNAITKITDAPTHRVGDTVKPLTRELDGFWRYRIGDYRLLYFPDLDTGSITIQEFSARCDIYD